MEKKISNAFTYMFKDKDWNYKILIFAGLFFASTFFPSIMSSLAIKKTFNPSMLPLILGLILILLVSAIFTAGYIAKCIQNIIFSDGTRLDLLPKWEDNFGEYFLIGIKRAFGGILVGIALLPTIILAGIPILIFSFLYSALEQTFCTEFQFHSFFAWKKGIDLVKVNPLEYIKIILLQFVLYIVMSILCNILITAGGASSSIILISSCAILNSVLMAYFSLVMAFLIGIIGGDYNRKKFKGESVQAEPPSTEVSS